MTNKELGAEMNQDPRPRPTVVVIGGGYGGVNVAKALDADVDVVLVEPKDAFVHNLGALRALVDPTFLPKIFLPYDRLLSHGRVARDRTVDVTAHRVVLASARRSRPITSFSLPDRRTHSPPRATRTMPRTQSTTIGPHTTN